MKRVLATCGLGLFSSVLFAADPPPPTRVALKAVRLIDGKGGRPIGPVAVLIENDRIVAAGVAVAIPPGTRVIDLGGATLLPGLIETHDHLTSIPEDSGYKALGVSVPREAMHGVAGSRKTLEAGFTTVRNVGAAGYADVAPDLPGLARDGGFEVVNASGFSARADLLNVS
jgi:imidazolonepropionase-like amidohydrolase